MEENDSCGEPVERLDFTQSHTLPLHVATTLPGLSCGVAWAHSFDEVTYDNTEKRVLLYIHIQPFIKAIYG